MADIKKRSKKGRDIIHKNCNRDLTTKELQSLFDEFNELARTTGIGNALFRIISDSFCLGVYQGYNAKH